MSRFSATTSMIQSASAHQARLSSKLPMVMRAAVRGREEGGGPRLEGGIQAGANDAVADARIARSRGRGISRRRVSSVGTISSSQQRTPALARCAAMRAPMVPAPRTATFSIRSMRGFIGATSLGAGRHLVTETEKALQEGYRTGKGGSTERLCIAEARKVSKYYVGSKWSPHPTVVRT